MNPACGKCGQAMGSTVEYCTSEGNCGLFICGNCVSLALSELEDAHEALDEAGMPTGDEKCVTWKAKWRIEMLANDFSVYEKALIDARAEIERLRGALLDIRAGLPIDSRGRRTIDAALALRAGKERT